MKKQNIITGLYGYIGFALVCVVLNILGFFSPLPDVLAAVSLFIACMIVGKYSYTSKRKK